MKQSIIEAALQAAFRNCYSLPNSVGIQAAMPHGANYCATPNPTGRKVQLGHLEAEDVEGSGADPRSRV